MASSSGGFNRLDPNKLPGAQAAFKAPTPTQRLGSFQNQELGALNSGTGSRVGQAQPLRPSQQLLGMSDASTNSVQFAQQKRAGAVRATNNRLMELAKQNGKRRQDLAKQQAMRQGNMGQQTLPQQQGGQAPAYGVGAGAGRPAVTRVQGLLRNFPGLQITETLGNRDYDRAHGVARGPNSFHYDRSNPAVDIAGSQDQLWKLYATLKQQGGWRQILWQVPGHYDHIHVA